MKRPALAWCTASSGLAVAAYGVLALALVWPLPLHLTSALLGDPGGDTGVYVWNLWVFRHELVDHSRLPLSTDHIFSYTGGSDFSLHNYTPLASVLALPLIPRLGIVGAYNVTLLLFLVLAGSCVYYLARGQRLSRVPAWAAGAIFIASPVLTARTTAHASLVEAAALPLFLGVLLRFLDAPRRRDALLLGVITACATYSDAYYGVYCLLMGLLALAWRHLRVDRTRAPATPHRATLKAVDLLCTVVVLAIAWRLAVGQTEWSIGSVHVRMATLYTPTLVLLVLGVVRAWVIWRPVLRFSRAGSDLGQLLRDGCLAVAVCLALMTPTWIGLVRRAVQGRIPYTETFWRSSPRGVDLLAYLVPNPNHAWLGRWTGRWLLPSNPDAFPEFVAALPLVALVLVGIAVWKGKVPRFWLAFTGFFVALSLGPFVHVGGVNTTLMGPWALLRYVPLIGQARSPSRFAIVAALGFSILFGSALQGWWERRRGVRLAVPGLLGALLLFEVMPFPRTLYSSNIPPVYQLIASDAEDGEKVLELPTGIRDGTSSLGDFNARTLYFQTSHGHPLVGGYLSRVSQWRKTENTRVPMLRALFELSDGAVAPDLETLREARRSRDAFLARSCVKFVVIDKRRASTDLQSFAVDALGLVPIRDDTERSLWTPTNRPQCTPPPRL
jgi:hypothetical protein